MARQNELCVFDLDGTLADGSHRVHYIQDRRKKDYDSYYARCGDDKPISFVQELAQRLYERYIIWIMTGRRDDTRSVTMEWLRYHRIPFNSLIMREKSDSAPDWMLKMRWIDEYKLAPAPAEKPGELPVAMVFEDRTRVVNMWRNKGFNCLQVAEGDF